MNNQVLTAYIERGNDGSYGVYYKEELPIGFFGEGASVEEAKADFESSLEAMKEELEGDERKALENIVIEYHYDVPSFLQYFSKIFTLAGLSRLTGINQGQLSHYMNGYRKPSLQTTQKIEESLHRLSDDLKGLHLI